MLRTEDQAKNTVCHRAIANAELWGTQCIASDCMAWRFAAPSKLPSRVHIMTFLNWPHREDDPTKWEKYTPADTRLAREVAERQGYVPLQGADVWDTPMFWSLPSLPRGYCGLAGPVPYTPASTDQFLPSEDEAKEILNADPA